MLKHSIRVTAYNTGYLMSVTKSLQLSILERYLTAFGGRSVKSALEIIFMLTFHDKN